MKKKILYAASVFLHFRAFHKPFMKDLMEKGYEVYAVANDTDGSKKELEEMGVKCFSVFFERSPLNRSNLKAISSLKRIFKNNYFDLIHVHTPVAAFIVRYLAYFNKQGRVLYTAHGFHFYKGAPKRNWILYFGAEKLAKRWTDSIIVMNTEDFFNAKKLGYKEGVSLFLTHGVGIDVENFYAGLNNKRSLKEELNLNSDSLIVTIVAELNHNKNQMFMLKSWKRILERQPGAHLIIVGEGSNENELKKFVKDESLSNTHFLGYRKDVSNILINSDIVCLLSYREGLPRILMEAMAGSKPLIGTNIRGINDLIKNNINGFLVTPNNNVELVKSVVTLLGNEQLRREFGNQSKSIIQDYDISVVKKELGAIYNKLLN